MSAKVNLSEKLARLSHHFAPRTVTECTGHHVMVAKRKGTFVWHEHDVTRDEAHVLSRPARPTLAI
ncbi:MAG TPA: hypothetical protein VNK52_09245 [Hyphomicrobiaceae bacterium]|nr:hypothetical protein [Hyphomicrobiaceae bacterium]